MKCPAYAEKICTLTGCDISCPQEGKLLEGRCYKYSVDKEEIVKIFSSSRKKITL